MALCLAESLRGNRVARRPPFSQERLLQAKAEPTPFDLKARAGVCAYAASA